MVWKTLGLCAAVAAFLGVSVVAKGSDGEGQGVLLEFAPPDGTKYIQWIETVREKEFKGLGTQNDWSKSRTDIVYRRVAEGFLLEARPVAMEMTRDDKPIVDPIFELIKDLTIRYRIDSEGQIEAIEGYEGLLDKAAKVLPPESVQLLAPVLDEDALVAREISEWNGRIGDFAFGEFEIGDELRGKVPFTLPNGEEIQYEVSTWFHGMEKCGDRECLRIEMRYDSDAKALADLVGGAVRDLVAPDFPEFSLSATGTRIAGGASRLMDPKTMLIYDERVHRTMTMEIEIPGVGKVPTIMREQKVYSFDFQEPDSPTH